MWACPVRFTVFDGPTRPTRLLEAAPAHGPVATTVLWKKPWSDAGSTATVTLATSGGECAGNAPRLSQVMVVGLELGLFTEMAPPFTGDVTVYFTPESAVRV